MDRKIAVASLIISATALFEAFNYSTTQHALGDAFGDLGFLGIPLATILALAFCGIDFAGIARLFSPDDRAADGRMEGMYLLGAWLLAGLMNATMTWWSVTEALLGRQNLGNEILARQDIILYVPIVVAGAVWLIRILLIGTLTLAGDKVLGGKPQPITRRPAQHPPVPSANPFPAAVRPFTGGRS
jgi:hypothetical protein